MNNFDQLCAPLHDTKQQVTFEWSDECDRNFQSLKAKLVSAPVLQPSIPSLESVVTVDASSEAIGVISQQDGNAPRFFSQMFHPKYARRHK